METNTRQLQLLKPKGTASPGFGLWGWIAVGMMMSAVGVSFIGFISGYLSVSSFLLIALLGIATFFDIRFGIIPNWLILVATGIGIGTIVAGAQPRWVASLCGATLSFIGILLLRWAAERTLGGKGMGMGDAKLVFAMGLLLGWDVFWVLYLSVFFGGLFSLVGIAAGQLHRKSRIPFAPFLLAGTCIALFLLPLDILIVLWK